MPLISRNKSDQKNIREVPDRNPKKNNSQLGDFSCSSLLLNTNAKNQTLPTNRFVLQIDRYTVMVEKLEILKRYFSGKYSRKDLHLVRELFLDKKNKSGLENELIQHWMDFEMKEEQKSINLAHLRNQIQHEIYLEENQKERTLQPLMRLQRIAAILFVPLLLGFAVYFISSRLNTTPVAYAEIICPEGTRTRFTLPDGSSGFLNNGSRLKYAVPFRRSRDVALVGEAFFDVVQDGTPFHVRTKKLDIAVTGTTFNVIAYDDDPTEEVVLQTGKVIISSTKGQKLSTLHPSQQLTFNLQNHQYQVRNVDAAQYTAWREGKLIFRNEGLEAVAKRIERWYNVTIDIKDEALKSYTYHATFMDHNLEELLRLLSLTSPMKFEIEKQNRNTSNEYLKKKKVILKIDHAKMNQFN